MKAWVLALIAGFAVSAGAHRLQDPELNAVIIGRAWCWQNPDGTLENAEFYGGGQGRYNGEASRWSSYDRLLNIRFRGAPWPGRLQISVLLVDENEMVWTWVRNGEARRVFPCAGPS